MTRFSLSNLVLPISYAQFTRLTEQFHRAAEASFGTKCEMEIRAMSAPKTYSTFLLDEFTQKCMDRDNESRTIATNFNRISKELWDQARYVELTISPVDKNAAPSYAFAHAEFKGVLPRQATFYIQPDGEDVPKTIGGFGMIRGDGYRSNGINGGYGFGF